MPFIGQQPLPRPFETNLRRALENTNSSLMQVSSGIRIINNHAPEAILTPADELMLLADSQTSFRQVVPTPGHSRRQALPTFTHPINRRALPTLLPAFGHSKQGSLLVLHNPVNCTINSTRRGNCSIRP